MKLHIVTINYNSAPETLNLLKCLDRQTDREFGCVLIDNGSQDYAQLTQFSERPWLKIQRNDRNEGFSAGNNIGIEQALQQGADYILFLNNDTRIEPNFIADLKQQSLSDGITALPIREGERVAYAGRIKWLRHTLAHQYTPAVPDPTLYAIGAGMIVHRSVFETIGLWDEKYFLYFEDADFSMRAHKAGVNFKYLTEPVITHYVSKSASKLGSSLLLRYHYRNMFLFNLRHAPWYIKIILPIWAFLGIVKQILKLITRPAERPQSRAIFGAILDYLTGRFGRLHDS